MSLFGGEDDINALLEVEQKTTIPGICQHCNHIHEVPQGETVYSCQLHEQPFPILTVSALFKVLSQIETAIKKTPTDLGVLEHKESFLCLMSKLQSAILSDKEEENPHE